MAILTVRDSKTGKVLRKVDGRTGRTVSSGSSSKKSSSSKSSSSSSSSSKQVYASRVPIGGDESQREYSVNGTWTKEKPKSSGGGSSRSSSSSKASNKGFTGEINFTDTKTGITTKEVVDLDTGKTIKKTSSKAKIPIAVQQTQANAKQDLLNKLNKVEIRPSINQQLNQQQTTTQEMRDFFKQKAKEEEAKKIKGFDFELRGKQKIRRAFKGETLEYTAFGPVVRKNDGSLRPLTNAETKEIQEKNTISLNPFNVGTAFWGTSKDIANFINSPNKKEQLKQAGKEILTNPSGVAEAVIRDAIVNPFGFIGDIATGEVVFKGGKEVFKIGQKATKTSFKKVSNIIESQGSKVKKNIMQLENDISTLKKTGGTSSTVRLKQKELNLAKQELKVIEADLNDLDKAIKTASKEPKTTAQAKAQVKDLKDTGKQFKGRSNKRKKIQQDKQKLLEQFEKERLAKSQPKQKAGNIKDRDAIKILNEQGLINVIKNNFKNPTQLKKIKKLILEEKGLRVKIHQDPKGLKVILKEANVNKKKGVGTKRADKQYLITEKGQIVRIDNKKGPKTSTTPKQTKSQIKKNEFEQGQKLEVQQKAEAEFLRSMEDLSPAPIKKGMFANKKGQVQLFKTTRKAVSKQKSVVNKLENKVKTTNNQYKNHIEKHKKIKENPTKSKVEQWKKTRDKLKEDINKKKAELSKAKAELKKLEKLLGRLAKISPALAVGLKPAQATLFGIAQDFAKVQDTIQDFKFPQPPKPKPKPSGGGSGGKGGSPKKPSGGSSSGTTPKPKPKPKSTPKPKPKPKDEPKKPRIKKGSSSSTNGARNLYTIQKKNKKGKWINTNFELPYNKALKQGADIVKGSITQTARVVLIGKTDLNDIKRPALDDIEVKRNGSTTTLKEKKAKALNTSLEKAQLKNAQIKSALLSASKKKKKTTKKKTSTKKKSGTQSKKKTSTTKTTKKKVSAPSKKKTASKKTVKKKSTKKTNSSIKKALKKATSKKKPSTTKKTTKKATKKANSVKKVAKKKVTPNKKKSSKSKPKKTQSKPKPTKKKSSSSKKSSKKKVTTKKKNTKSKKKR